MKIQIKSRFTNAVIFETDAESIGEAVAAAIKASANLKGANLEGANLEGANLKGANLEGANLYGASLEGAYLYGASLEGAYLYGANLEGANLYGANLYGANLYGANLEGAYLKGAYLKGAYLEGENLEGAYLEGANLEGANLKGAYLKGANLKGANLYGANLEGAKGLNIEELLATRAILPDGDLIGWKKLSDGVMCKLLIPANAKRVGGVVGRKCRAEFATVLEGEGVSQHNSQFRYVVRATVTPDKFDPNPLVECSNGIHFFITKSEAEAY